MQMSKFICCIILTNNLLGKFIQIEVLSNDTFEKIRDRFSF